MRYTLCVIGVVAAIFSSIIEATASPVGAIRPRARHYTAALESSRDRREMRWEQPSLNRYTVESNRYLGSVSYGFSDRIELVGRFGFTDLDIFTKAGAGYGTSYAGDPRFTAGLSLGGILHEKSSWNLAAHVGYLVEENHHGSWPGGLGNDAEIGWSEWQIGVQIQGQMEPFTPFLGVKYSKADLSVERPQGAAFSRLVTDDEVGVYIGSAVELTPKWSGYLEGRFIDETAYGIGLRFHY